MNPSKKDCCAACKFHDTAACQYLECRCHIECCDYCWSKLTESCHAKGCIHCHTDSTKKPERTPETTTYNGETHVVVDERCEVLHIYRGKDVLKFSLTSPEKEEKCDCPCQYCHGGYGGYGKHSPDNCPANLSKGKEPSIEGLHDYLTEWERKGKESSRKYPHLKVDAVGTDTQNLRIGPEPSFTDTVLAEFKEKFDKGNYWSFEDGNVEELEQWLVSTLEELHDTKTVLAANERGFNAGKKAERNHIRALIEAKKKDDPKTEWKDRHPGITWDKCEACTADYFHNAALTSLAEELKNNA